MKYSYNLYSYDCKADFSGAIQKEFTLKNKGASRCHRIFFLYKWFHKEPLTSEEPYNKRFFVAKEDSSDYKKVRMRWFFKEPLTEWFFVEPKMVLYGIAMKNVLKHFCF